MRVQMDIVLLPFEESLTIEVNGERIRVVTFKTQEHGNIKFGIDAPRSVNVHREEIYHAIKQKQLLEQIES
jgi:carbon storage regulator